MTKRGTIRTKRNGWMIVWDSHPLKLSFWGLQDPQNDYVTVKSRRCSTSSHARVPMSPEAFRFLSLLVRVCWSQTRWSSVFEPPRIVSLPIIHRTVPSVCSRDRPSVCRCFTVSARGRPVSLSCRFSSSSRSSALGNSFSPRHCRFFPRQHLLEVQTSSWHQFARRSRESLDCPHYKL